MTTFSLLHSYLKIAFRNLRKHKLVTFINIFGLGLSLSVGMMQLIILQHELGYDHFHPHPSRTFRVITNYQGKNGNHWRLASTPLPLFTPLASDTTVVADIVSIYPAFQQTAKAAGKELNLRGAFTQPSFFRVFGFSLAAGNVGTALSSPGNMIVTQTVARKFFGTGNAVGKSLEVPGWGQYQITGILNEPPGKSHLDFDVYVAASDIASLENKKLLPARSADWQELRTAYTYVLLRNGSGEQSLKGLLKSVAAATYHNSREESVTFETQPLGEISPGHDDIYNDIGRGTSWSKLWTGIDISLIILLAACFNYTNLTIARALSRAREVGIRKVAGAHRYQLFTQYIIESVLLALLALAFAWLLLSLIIRYAPFNDGYEMIPSSWRYNAVYIVSTVGFALFTGLLAGAAPAWILSAFKPARVLKNLATARLFGKIGLQKVLIVFQYSLSLVILIFLFTFYRQFSFLGEEDPGFRRENVAVVPLGDENAARIATQLKMVPGVVSVSAMSDAFRPHFSGSRSNAKADEKQQEGVTLNYLFVDTGFLRDMGIRFLAGHAFQSSTTGGAEKEIILNDRAVRGLGLSSPEKAIGHRVNVNDSTSLLIVGVVSDFHYENAGKPVDPLAFRQAPSGCHYLYLQAPAGMTASQKAAFMQRLEASWKTLGLSVGFSASWLKQDLDNNNSQSATIALLGYLAFIALGIATLGLLGLVIFTIETRRKEIGIRKVLGASGKQVIRILSGRYVRLLFVAGAIAVPVGYTLSFLFLQNFVQRVGYGLFSAIGCFLFLLAIGLVTIFSQTYRASRDNPVDSLRIE